MTLVLTRSLRVLAVCTCLASVAATTTMRWLATRSLVVAEHERLSYASLWTAEEHTFFVWLKVKEPRPHAA